MPPDDPEITRLQSSIAALESQRHLLGDKVVDISVRLLREKLDHLLTRLDQAPMRRLITVLFAEVQGVASQSDNSSVADVAVMNRVWPAVDAVVPGHGGRIDKHMGDIVMALWGAGGSREDDAEMAVRAALAMQAAVTDVSESFGIPLSVRAGIHTGPVLLGMVGTTGEFTAMGDTVNLANRLVHAAPANGVLISHDTYRHIRGVFDVSVQPLLSVKGKDEPVQTYVVLRAKTRAFRLSSRGVEGVETRMVGRDKELAALCEAYEDVLTGGTARSFLIVGEAGVGKSRLLHEFDNWLELRPEKVLYFKGRSSRQLQNVPHAVFRNLFAYRYGILESDPAGVALDKFRQGMAPVLAPEQADIVGHWLGFDFASSPHVAPLLGSSAFAAVAQAHLLHYLRTLAARAPGPSDGEGNSPVVLLLEDIHWADPGSLELARHIADAMQAERLLLLAATRRSLFERDEQWRDPRHPFQHLNLLPLSREASETLVAEILQRAGDVPARIRDLISEAAEGNPFYVEEMVNMLVDRGVIVREQGLGQVGHVAVQDTAWSERWSIHEDRLGPLKIPLTLTALLQARLDGLPKDERVALQRAAVVGRLFWDDAVAAIDQSPLSVLQIALAHAGTRELIFRREQSSFAGAQEYVFKHNLLRDVAYETVLLKHRAEYHRRVAHWLEEHAGDRRDEYAGLIAEHYIEAGERLKAADLLQHAGLESARVGAFAAARQALERSLALAEAAGERDSRAACQSEIALGRVLRSLGELQAAESALERAQAGARAVGDRVLEAEATAFQAYVMADRGKMRRAKVLATKALELAGDVPRPLLASLYYSTAGVAWHTGELDSGEKLAQEAITRAREAGDAATEILSLNMLGIIRNSRRDLEGAEAVYATALDRVRQTGNLFMEATLLGNLGVCAYLRGEMSEALHYSQTAVDRTRYLGDRGTTSLQLITVAQVLLRMGDIAAAKEGARESMDLARSLGMQPSALWGIFLSGQIALAAGEPERALSLFGLARSHPAAEHQLLLEIDEELSQLSAPAEVIAEGLARGALLNLETVLDDLTYSIW